MFERIRKKKAKIQEEIDRMWRVKHDPIEQLILGNDVAALYARIEELEEENQKLFDVANHAQATLSVYAWDMETILNKVKNEGWIVLREEDRHALLHDIQMLVELQTETDRNMFV